MMTRARPFLKHVELSQCRPGTKEITQEVTDNKGYPYFHPYHLLIDTDFLRCIMSIFERDVSEYGKSSIFCATCVKDQFFLVSFCYHSNVNIYHWSKHVTVKI